MDRQVTTLCHCHHCLCHCHRCQTEGEGQVKTGKERIQVSRAHLLSGEHGWMNKCGTSVCEFEGVGLMSRDPRLSHVPRKEAFIIIVAHAIIGILIVNELIS